MMICVSVIYQLHILYIKIDNSNYFEDLFESVHDNIKIVL